MAAPKDGDPSNRAFSILLANYIRRCRKRNIFWGLSREDFRRLTRRKCVYCGKPPTQRVWTHDPTKTYLYNGVDRKNNKLGYTPENSLPCCGRCNGIKSNRLSHAEMLAVARVLKKKR